MKKFFLKYTFFFVAILIVLVIFNPPRFLRSIGWQGYLILPALYLLFLFIFFPGYSFVRSVYRKFELIPLDKQINRRDIQILMDELNSLGFTQAGPVLDLPGYAVIIVPFVHEELDTYCTIIRAQVGFGKTTFAFSSIFDDNSGGLATYREHFNAMEPKPSGSFRQVFPGADLQSNFQHHLRGLEYLHRYGLNTRQVNRETFVEDETKAVMRRNEFLRNNLVRHTIIFVLRFLIRRTPNGGPLEKQKDAQKSLRVLNREPVSGTDTKCDLRQKKITEIEIMLRHIHATLRHSGLGIASFMISMVIIGFFFFLLFLAVIIAVIGPDLADTNSTMISTIGAFLMLSSLASLVGLGFGYAGLKQINRKKVFSILGVVFNLMIIAGMIVLTVFGRMVS
ncbi:MAG: hypothetical protein ACYSWZ_16245 [Planctomycetota bacterium]|jgi:hypothetical protein